MVDDGGLRPSWNPYTIGVILIILATQFVRWCSARFRFTVAPPNLNPKTNANVAVSPSSAALSQPRLLSSSSLSLFPVCLCYYFISTIHYTWEVCVY